MAGASLLALIDDIATILDDVALMTKVAARKTAGVLGDDLALNAQQVAGVRAERELPVVWAVAVGSLKNKLILVPAALVISSLLPSAVVPLLMIGGLYLCFEGVEKLAHSQPRPPADAPPLTAAAENNVDLTRLEADKIKGAIRTDFVLSAEIVVIALGTVAEASFATQVAVLSCIGLLMTVGVYGTVAGIVKMDDLGLHLLARPGTLAQTVGNGLLLAAPRLMKVLTVVGTAAMFLVGGGILTHGMPPVHGWIEHAGAQADALPAALAPLLRTTLSLLLEVLVGMVAGTLTLAAVKAFSALRSASTGKRPDNDRLS